MNKDIRKRIVKRLYGDAWKEHWGSAPTSLEIAVYKRTWMDDHGPAIEAAATQHEVHTWFKERDISRIDYDMYPSIGDNVSMVMIRDPDIRALFKLTFG